MVLVKAVMREGDGRMKMRVVYSKWVHLAMLSMIPI